MTIPRILLSPPHLGGREHELVEEALRSGWLAPDGPFLARFEREVAERVGVGHAVAVSSGTAALHLALLEVGVGQGDEVLVSTFTFSASVNPIVYAGGRPVLVDSERTSWNMDPQLLADTLAGRARSGRLPRAVVLAHTYGQSANLSAIAEICDRYGVPLIEDAAEALGATFGEESVGSWGRLGVFSFNGNKIVTTSGGGMLVSRDERLTDHARKIAAQSREVAPHYEHAEIGYNYRLSNILAAIGIAQLETLDDRIRARRANFDRYRNALGHLPGVTFMPDPGWGMSTRWLSCVLIDPLEAGVSREDVRRSLDAEGIESRPLWKPMHCQPVFKDFEAVGGRVAEDLFRVGLCLPSGSSLTVDEIDRVTAAFERCVQQRPGVAGGL